jgi:endo-1,4-beta-D-glucanase Y
MKNKFTTYLAGVIIPVLFSLSAFGQVNTPAGANWPFGSRIVQFPTAPYGFGIIPTNLPSAGAYGKSQDAYNAYTAWKTNYIVSCGGSPVSMRIKFDDPNQTVSEGIGYGMLLAAYAADKALFDGLYTYYKNNIVAGYGNVMGWKRNGCANGNTGSSGDDNGATDADMDAAMALIVAKCQWPTATSPYDYGTNATTLIGQIRQWEITNASCGTANQISNGDGFVVGNSTCRNPGYQTPAYIKLFQAFDPGAPANYWTTTVYNTIYPLINANNDNTTGLVSNWCDNTGTANTCNSPAFLDYGYDACRYPWRMATDYLWHGDANASAICILMSDNFIGTRATLGNAASYSAIKGPVTLAGATNGRTTPSENSIFTSTWAVGCMGVTTTANRQTRLNDMYSRTVAVTEAYSASQPTNYFNNTLRTLMLFVLSGNFWKPCPPRCQAPVLPSDTVSVCSGTPNITLNSSLTTATNRTFTWFKNGASLGLTTPTISISTAGKYWVQVDSTACSRADTVIVSATLPYPKLGFNKTVCSPAPVVLDANVSNTPAYTYQWAYSPSSWATLSDITYQGNSQTYNAKKTGLYRVTISAGACVSRFDTITVVSQLPTPVDGCLNPGPGTVNLGITNTSGAASNYDWYAAATGGSPLTTGSGGTGVTSFTTPSLSTTTTYYVQDNTPQPGYVGLKVPTIANYSTTFCNAFPALTSTPGAGTDNANSYANTFTTYRNNITIDSITVFYCLYNANPLAVTFELRNATGASIISNSGVQTVTPVLPANWISASYNTNGGVIGVRFKVGISVATAGTYRLTMTSGSPGNVFIHQTAAIAYAYIDNIDGNTLRINDTYGYTTSYVTRYGPLYNWRITAPKICDRLPVTAYVNAGSCGTVLPVDLLKFTARGYKNTVKLDWATASEKNSNYFIVERSADNNSFVEIGKVMAVQNSTSINYYSFEDKVPLTGGAYYRLAYYDKDGASYYSAIQYVSEVSSGSIRVFPNPANNVLNIVSYDTQVEFTSIAILDLMGKEMFFTNESTSEKQLDISGLPAGIYMVRVKLENYSETIRLIKN